MLHANPKQAGLVQSQNFLENNSKTMHTSCLFLIGMADGYQPHLRKIDPSRVRFDVLLHQ
jgi:hypothetical protein